MSTKKLQLIGSIVTTDETLTKSGVAADAKVVGDALEEKQPVGDYVLKDDIVQPDWNQNNETASDYIKNKPTEYDAIKLAAEMGFVEPVISEDGSIYTDENGNVYTLI